VALQEIRIPDIGDAEDVEVIEILVKAGADVAVDDPLIVIESDKASMEVPATAAGKLEKIAVAIGDKVREGQVIAVVDAAGAQAKGPSAPKSTTTQQPKPSSQAGVAKPEAPPKPATPKENVPTKAQSTTNANAASNARSSAPAQKSAGPTSRPTADAATAPSDSARKQRIEVRVPDIGDAQDVAVIEIAVKPGQTVAVDDLLVVLESDKASMEIPAPVPGRIVSVDVADGAKVEEGSLIVVIETTEAGAPSKERQPELAADEVKPPPESPTQGRGDGASRPDRSDAAAIAESPPSERADEPTPAPPSGVVYAGPAVRRLARELGVDLAKVKGTGTHGRILKDDVDGYVRAALSAPKSQVATSGIPPIPTIDFSRFGQIETVALTRIRARGAGNLHRSWLNVPHVTQHDEADVSDLESFREELKAEAQSKGIKLTPLAFIVKATVAMLKQFPTFNASLDASVRNIILKRYYHIGLAVDTPDGLVVPVLRNADQKGVFELAKEIETLSQKAQQNKLAVGDLQGASFTISSLGAIGGTAFTPIINAPEVAILGVSRLTMKPHWNGTAFEPRRVLPVSLSYDHRAINGAEAGRFVTSLCQSLKDMRRVLL
jgi:pyruvate dehydrogenase E2 component (dihydrolipoamide acetyltransferase)